ncbi:MAG: LD-carboxypeptidase [Ignavibacteriaceae bacterium]
MNLVKPKKLKKGDVIGFISPASSPNDLTRIEKGTKYFESLGYRVEVGKNVGKYYGYLAGTDQERADDIHDMFTRRDVKAIICLRGGYGTPRLMRFINFDLIKNNPKILVGYSDITTLQTAIYRRAKLLTFAGPMVAVDFWAEEVNKYTEELFWRALTSTKKIGKVAMPNDEYKMEFRGKENAEGTIIGGNLTHFAVLLGSKYFPEMKNNILILEDVDEVPYRIDRYFAELFNAKVFKDVKGLILGQFTDCEEKDAEKRTLNLEEAMGDYLNELKIPIIRNFPHGHVKATFTIPLGTHVKMNMKKGYVEFTESGVV